MFLAFLLQILILTLEQEKHVNFCCLVFVVGAVQCGTPPPVGTTTTTASPNTTPVGWQRTVVFLFFQSMIGQEVFIRGGIDAGRSAGKNYWIRVLNNSDSVLDLYPLTQYGFSVKEHYF